MFEAQPRGARKLKEPIEVMDYVGMGSMVADWSTGRRALPRDVGELRDQLDGIATVSDRVTELEFVQGTSEKLVIRLPVREMIEASRQMPDGCACAEVLVGRKTPAQCAMFAHACSPTAPIGPCMASEDGTCFLHRSLLSAA